MNSENVETMYHGSIQMLEDLHTGYRLTTWAGAIRGDTDLTEAVGNLELYIKQLKTFYNIVGMGRILGCMFSKVHITLPLLWNKEKWLFLASLWSWCCGLNVVDLSKYCITLQILLLSPFPSPLLLCGFLWVQPPSPLLEPTFLTRNPNFTTQWNSCHTIGSRGGMEELVVQLT